MNQIKELVEKLYFFLLPTSGMRTRYIYKHNVFESCGKNLVFQPRKLPADPKFIRFHNNVAVAADVTFVNHDVIELVLRNIDPKNNWEHVGCIEVKDNVFIGLGSIILPGVKIGPNAIIAAGSIVTKDVPPNSVVGGSPAKVIGSFEAVQKKRLEESLKEHRFAPRSAENAAEEWFLFDRRKSAAE